MMTKKYVATSFSMEEQELWALLGSVNAALNGHVFSNLITAIFKPLNQWP